MGAKVVHEFMGKRDRVPFIPSVNAGHNQPPEWPAPKTVDLERPAGHAVTDDLRTAGEQGGGGLGAEDWLASRAPRGGRTCGPGRRQWTGSSEFDGCCEVLAAGASRQRQVKENQNTRCQLHGTISDKARLPGREYRPHGIRRKAPMACMRLRSHSRIFRPLVEIIGIGTLWLRAGNTHLRLL